jgi:hypothetical protein
MKKVQSTDKAEAVSLQLPLCLCLAHKIPLIHSLSAQFLPKHLQAPPLNPSIFNHHNLSLSGKHNHGSSNTSSASSDISGKHRYFLEDSLA